MLAPPSHSDLLNELVRSGASLSDLARTHNLSAAQLLAFVRDPAIRADLAELLRFSRRITEFTARQSHPLALATLHALAASPDADPSERRRAAIALLHAPRLTRWRSAPRETSPDSPATPAPSTPSFNISDRLHSALNAHPKRTPPPDFLDDLDPDADLDLPAAEPPHRCTDQLDLLAEHLRDALDPLLPLLTAPDPSPAQLAALAPALPDELRESWTTHPLRLRLVRSRSAILDDILPASPVLAARLQTSASASLVLDDAAIPLRFSRNSPADPWQPRLAPHTLSIPADGLPAG